MRINQLQSVTKTLCILLTMSHLLRTVGSQLLKPKCPQFGDIDSLRLNNDPATVQTDKCWKRDDASLQNFIYDEISLSFDTKISFCTSTFTQKKNSTWKIITLNPQFGFSCFADDTLKTSTIFLRNSQSPLPQLAVIQFASPPDEENNDSTKGIQIISDKHYLNCGVCSKIFKAVPTS